MSAFLLDGRAGWRDEPALCVGVHTGDVLRLAADADLPRPLADASGSFGGLSEPTGTAGPYRVDRAGNRLLRYDDCEQDFLPVPCFGGRGSGVRQLDDPHGVAVTETGDVVVADTGNKRLIVLTPGGEAVRRVIARPDWTPFDVAFSRGRLLVADRDGGLVHVLTCAGRHLDAWTSAAPVALAVDRDGRIYVADEGSPLVHVYDLDGTLLETRTTTEGLADRFDAAPAEPSAYAATGTFVTAPLDGRRHGQVWHRIELDADIPAGAGVTVHTLTAEVPLTAAEVAALPADRWAGGQEHGVVGRDPWDCLVLGPPGRYLWLRLTLTGGPARTPAVHGVRAEYPRRTSLRYLPAAYREEPVSADFTDRFLAILDAVRATVSARIDALPAYLDPYASPPEFLDYLAAWLGLADDLRLPLARKRELVARAHELYRLRGTPAGIRLHLRICTGIEAYVMEEYRLRRWLYLGSGRLGDDSAVWDDEVVRRLQLDANSRIGSAQLIGSTDPLRDPFHVHAHRFRVYLPAAEDAGLRRLAERVLTLAAPAHTLGRVVLVAPRMRIGVQSFLGIDSVVGAYPAETVTGAGRLGSDTVLGTAGDLPDRTGSRIGRTTRVGTGTVLE
ncbi:phage tail protein [Paractinoplanes globisporus]|uniref:Phage tail protein n=1 Tax=Paractinoplanes globisporus TaxID=113565 RepID=A0ABW6W6S5_9ACTN|nr:phage tail protein [Actinoplanes globisporus]